MKQLKKLPKFYVIEIEDIYGKKAAVDGLRINFTTFAAAKSYAHFYSDLYGEQYKFRIIGRNRILNYPHSHVRWFSGIRFIRTSMMDIQYTPSILHEAEAYTQMSNIQTKLWL